VQGDELAGEEVRDPADQSLFGGKIVMQRRDIDAGTVGDAAGAQPLETVGRKTGESGAHQAVAAFVTPRPRLLFPCRHVERASLPREIKSIS